MDEVLLIFGNQLFAPQYLADHKRATVVLVEDRQLCTRYTYHKQKLIFMLTAMRSYAKCLRDAQFSVRYFALDDECDWQAAVAKVASQLGAKKLIHFEVESAHLTASVAGFAESREMALEVLQTPMFLGPVEDFSEHLAGYKRPLMQRFYKQQRVRHDVLLTPVGEPVGGQWSFDEMNRKKLPKTVLPQEPPVYAPSALEVEVEKDVATYFGRHPGAPGPLWLPVTHADALRWFEHFLEARLYHFGAYEDALTTRSTFVFHSAISPLLNVGLLTPRQVLDLTLSYAVDNDIPLNSTEGFVRQILGWREFMRGIFHTYGETMRLGNHWRAGRKLTPAWYEGNTGLPPLDHVITKTVKYGWAHHIERLMVMANLMNLSGIHPSEVYRWFMEMYVDAYAWVMVPNIFGMGLTSDGGIFSTKPYICGSNYLLKMSDYRRGPWCDVVDGLFWGFVQEHRTALKTNHRLAPMIANLDRVKTKRPEIFRLGEEFIDKNTLPY